MIYVRNLSLTINKHQILTNVSIEAKSGEAVGLVGGNGSGKTMLMKCICGFNSMFTGEIEVLGDKIGKDAEFPKNTGFIIETPGFMPYLSGYENLKLLAGIRKKIGRDKIAEYMGLTGLDIHDHKKVKKYSLGMRQRLGLTQALMEDPDILILDEPFNGLDRKMAEKMRNVLNREKERGKTILLSSHIFSEVDATCDRIAIIKDGKVVSEFVANDLKHATTKYYKVFFKNKGDAKIFSSSQKKCEFLQILDKNEKENWVFISTDDKDINKVISLLSDFELLEFSNYKETLEDYFMKFYKEDKEFGGV